MGAHFNCSERFTLKSRFRQQAAKIISGLAALFILMGAEVSLAQSEDETVTERRLKVSDYRQKMMAGWIGQMVGVGWGAPTEFRWTNEIIPEDQVPEWRPEMVNVWGQDDLYVEMTFLRSLEEYGLDISMRQAGIDFANSKYDLWHANKAGRDNLRQGIAPPDSSHPQFNIHADDIDYQIEADFSGLISPGLPNSVIALGEKFGRLMNYGDGVYGGQFVGCMYAEAFFEEDPQKIIDAGLKCIPEGSQYAEMVRDVISWHAENSDDWQATWQLINKKYHENPDYIQCLCTEKGGDFNIDAKINGAYILLGLLYGRGDFDQSIITAMRAGQDSDCNPSNAGGILFTTSDYDSLDDKYTSALELGTKFSYTEYDFEALADVSEKLARQIVVQSGGSIEIDENGEEVFVIPMQEPNPSNLEQCWDAGPIAETTFTSEEFPHLGWLWITALLVWLALLLAFVSLPENRNARALWIFAAVISAYLIWEIIKLPIPKQFLDIEQSIAVNHAIGLAIVFLLGDRLAKLKWPALSGIAFFVIIATGFVGFLGKGSVYFDGLDVTAAVTIVAAAIVIVLATILTARQCQNNFSKSRFLRLLLMWIFLSQFGVSLVVITATYGLDVLVEYWYWWLMTIGIYAVGNYLMTLPLWVLAMTNSLYEQRLRSCLNLNKN